MPANLSFGNQALECWAGQRRSRLAFTSDSFSPVCSLPRTRLSSQKLLLISSGRQPTIRFVTRACISFGKFDIAPDVRDSPSIQPQRGCVPKPRVARHELPWVTVHHTAPTATRL